MRELFVYWHVDADRTAAAEAVARELQDVWCQRWPGLEARLYRRTDAAVKRLTWMETYAHPGGLSEQQQQAIADEGDARLGTLIGGARHLEVFERA